MLCVLVDVLEFFGGREREWEGGREGEREEEREEKGREETVPGFNSPNMIIDPPAILLQYNSTYQYIRTYIANRRTVYLYAGM